MATIKLWKDKQKGLLDPELFSKDADLIAKEISDEGKRERKEKNKSTQLRRFFDEVVRLNTQAQTDKDNINWNMILPHVHMLIAKIAYAQGRELVTPSFVDLMRSGITQIEDKKDLQVFTNFLEAFMGFYKAYRPK
jgi:CRISPR-associated protein Csm2